MAKKTTLVSVREFSQRHPAFSEASLRWLIFNAESNGLTPAILKIGRKVVIDERELLKLLKKRAGESK